MPKNSQPFLLRRSIFPLATSVLMSLLLFGFSSVIKSTTITDKYKVAASSTATLSLTITMTLATASLINIMLPTSQGCDDEALS